MGDKGWLQLKCTYASESERAASKRCGEGHKGFRCAPDRKQIFALDFLDLMGPPRQSL